MIWPGHDLAMSESRDWVRREVTGDAGELHGLVADPDDGRQLWHLAVDAPALVLGSTQLDTVDRAAADAAGVSVHRRRSGGGAVLLMPGESTWVDVVIARGDVLWDDDVTRSFAWLGDAWVEALHRSGIDERGLAVHRGALVRGALGGTVCFAGLGPGEVTTVGRGEPGGKLVGLSQRRTRELARFQCTVHHRWRPELYRSLLPAEIAPDAVLAPVATIQVPPSTLVATLLEVLATR